MQNNEDIVQAANATKINANNVTNIYVAKSVYLHDWFQVADVSFQSTCAGFCTNTVEN